MADEVSADKIDLYPIYITAWKVNSLDQNQKVSALKSARVIIFMISLNFGACFFLIYLFF
ncbi:MAG TPA: hypothetical protein DEF05_11275 [Erwinia sp.]|nr:hypothetical protein [Erwinia sp.]